jgi:hypothetical protein
MAASAVRCNESLLTSVRVSMYYRHMKTFKPAKRMTGTRVGFPPSCLELSRAAVEQLVIAELRRRHPNALPVSVDFEPRTEGGFCHCWWTMATRKACDDCDGTGLVPDRRDTGTGESWPCTECNGTGKVPL